ncbi:MAG: hypothetical protein WC522_05835 [Candidatus Omnitrophota bacterium]
MIFNFEATGIGSVPFKDPRAACEIILDNFPVIPFWPQLARGGYRENMYVQYSERLPGLVLDEKNRKIHIDTAKAPAGIEAVYTKYLENDVEFFKISEDYARGLYEFLSNAKNLPGTVKFLKGQITGPISYGLFLTDQDKRSILYDKDLFEVLTKVLVMKAKWQIRKLKALRPDVIMFIDEPSLVSLGSSYVNINPAIAFERLDELVKAIKDEGALCGLHCCGNTDWPALLARDIDIINFDAYNFMKEFLLYGDEFKSFLRRGAGVAWGVVPTSEEIVKQTPAGLAQRLNGVSGSSLVTPSCGVGTLSEDIALKVFRTTKEVSRLLRSAGS